MPKSRCLPAAISDAGSAGASRGTSLVARNAGMKLEALRDAASQLRQRLQEMTDEMADLPNGLNWNRLSQEMTGNIRVGLAAGEAIALFDKPLRGKPRLGCLERRLRWWLWAPR